MLKCLPGEEDDEEDDDRDPDGDSEDPLESPEELELAPTPEFPGIMAIDHGFMIFDGGVKARGTIAANPWGLAVKSGEYRRLKCQGRSTA
ncbi:hypothetical protein JCM33374_g1686 [Metschnikowia sp. JCM 33374]|nr:hypothetical protein JCM33374_g1686 [Metschnikowia sp. JCM 33374]